MKKEATWAADDQGRHLSNTGLINEYELAHRSPERIYDFLKQRAESKDNPHYDPLYGLDEIAELKLLERNEPLIDLAIARYCKNSEALEAVFEKAQKTDNLALKLACLKNTYTYSYDGVERISRKFQYWRSEATEQEIYQLFSHEDLPARDAVGFVCGKKDDEFDIGPELWHVWDDVKRRAAIVGLADNKRMLLDGFKIGYLWHEDNIFSPALRLADQVEVNVDWAHSLSILYSKMPVRPWVNLATIERWNIKAQDAPQHSSLHRVSRRDAPGFLSSFEDIRFQLYRFLRKDEPHIFAQAMESEDKALQAYICKFQALTPDEMKQAYAKNSSFYFHCMLENEQIWQNAETRYALRRMDEDGFFYDLEEKRWKEERPEWFEEERIAAESATETEVLKEEDKPVTAKAMQEVMSKNNDAVLSRIGDYIGLWAVIIIIILCFIIF